METRLFSLLKSVSSNLLLVRVGCTYECGAFGDSWSKLPHDLRDVLQSFISPVARGRFLCARDAGAIMSSDGGDTGHKALMPGVIHAVSQRRSLDARDMNKPNSFNTIRRYRRQVVTLQLCVPFCGDLLETFRRGAPECLVKYKTFVRPFEDLSS
jgi:hypothetical protein